MVHDAGHEAHGGDLEVLCFDLGNHAMIQVVTDEIQAGLHDEEDPAD